jgi:hypothetical protein
MTIFKKIFTKTDHYLEYKKHCKIKKVKQVGTRHHANEIHDSLVALRQLLLQKLETSVVK